GTEEGRCSRGRRARSGGPRQVSWPRGFASPAFCPRILYRQASSQHRRDRPWWSPEEELGEQLLLWSPVGETGRDQTARSAGQVVCEDTATSKWIPAYAGMTKGDARSPTRRWIPAFAGMTNVEVGETGRRQTRAS